MENSSTRALRGIATLLAMLAAGMAESATFTVTTFGNAGTGSLRHAIEQANSTGGADTIEFGLAGSGAITLTSSLPAITDDLEIIGPGPGTLSVRGSNQFRPFTIASGTTVTISGLTIREGLAPDTGSPNGGGISNQGNLTLEDCVISGNSAGQFGFGGGIDSFNGTLTVIGCSIQNNSADSGGGISSDGTLVMIDSRVVDNTSTAIDGGISNGGTAVVIRSLIAGNASEFGGGIGNGGDLRVENSTISGNVASVSSGGIDNLGGSVELLHVTVADNSAPTGGGILIENDNGFLATIMAKNSLVAGNSGGDCEFFSGEIQGFGINFDTDGSCSSVFKTTSPPALALEPLADNGGPTRTHALADNSAVLSSAFDCTALDETTPVATDQRGASRPQGDGCEPGAFESSAIDLIFADGFE